MILDKVNYPKDLKGLSVQELAELSDEIRELVIKKVNVTGGHMAPNLGIVEAVVAMHYVFNAPYDKIVFDVSHQCYPHKILTGRKEGFLNSDKYLDYTGYSAPEESEYDLFKMGHTSTSISFALGVAKARDLKGGRENVIALIGDGSLSGGEALEGLDLAGELNSNIIIIVNDNQMSIAENHGALYKNLKLLRDTKGKSEHNLFKCLGFDYYYEENGNDIEALIKVFDKVKDVERPVVVHINTVKGKGLDVAQNNKEAFHFVMPNVLDENKKTENAESYTSLTIDFVLEKLKTDKTLSIVNAGTPGVFGFVPSVREKLGVHYTDVGIAEEHGVTFTSALAKMGCHSMFFVMSSFIQRAYDQLSQDFCLNNSPATILVYWAGITDGDATHLTLFDIPLLSNIPNLVYLAPTNKEEYLKMLEFSYSQDKYPVAIRVPNVDLKSKGIEDDTDYSILNKYKVEKEGEGVALLGLGNFLGLAYRVSDILEKQGINATIINPRFITGCDKELLDKLKANHRLVATLEDGLLDGGFGEKIARYYGIDDIKVLNFGARKEFTDRVPLNELYERYHLTPEIICEDILKNL